MEFPAETQEATWQQVDRQCPERHRPRHGGDRGLGSSSQHCSLGDTATAAPRAVLRARAPRRLSNPDGKVSQAVKFQPQDAKLVLRNRGCELSHPAATRRAGGGGRLAPVSPSGPLLAPWALCNSRTPPSAETGAMAESPGCGGQPTPAASTVARREPLCPVPAHSAGL